MSSFWDCGLMRCCFFYHNVIPLGLGVYALFLFYRIFYYLYFVTRQSIQPRHQFIYLPFHISRGYWGGRFVWFVVERTDDEVLNFVVGGSLFKFYLNVGNSLLSEKSVRTDPVYRKTFQSSFFLRCVAPSPCCFMGEERCRCYAP